VSVLRQKVKVIVDLDNDEKEIREYDASELKFTKKKRSEKPKRGKDEIEDENLSKEEILELEALERE
ncbi:MAG: stage 0 sporulation protein, partial [Lachnospiraceae bacterium]|nr:stage 0 sporulation protein [Lachnospiraceae bacterium]